METRDTQMVNMIKGLLPAGTNVEELIAKQPGTTRIQKIVKCLESLNEVKSTSTLDGFFVAYIETKQKKKIWKVAMPDKQLATVNLGEERLPTPRFGDNILITNIEKILHKVSNYTEYTPTANSKITIKPGDILSATIDIGQIDESGNYHLTTGSLYQHNVFGDKGLMGDKGLNLKITICSNEESDNNKRRYVQAFIKRTEHLLALFPVDDQPHILTLLEKGDYFAVEEALASIEYNQNLRLPGAPIVAYGIVELKSWKGRDNTEKQGWQLGVMSIHNLDNLINRPPEIIETKLESFKPTDDATTITPTPEGQPQVEITPTPPTTPALFVPTQNQIEIINIIKETPDIKTMPLLEAINNRCKLNREESLKAINELVENRKLETKNGKFILIE